MLTKVSFAQVTAADGHIVMNNNDTISGKLEYGRSGFENRCVFINTSSGKIAVFRPSGIKQFSFHPDMNFESKEINGKMVFLQALSKGVINLYSDGKDLYVSSTSDSVSRLRGGHEAVVIKGLNYSKKVDTYKSQISAHVADPFFYNKIADLYFDQKPILRLVKEINKDHSVSDQTSKSKLDNPGHYGVKAGFSINSLRTYFLYDHDSFFELEQMSNSHFANSWVTGFSYKRKMGKTRSYIGAGIQYDQMFRTTIEKSWLLYRTITIPNDGPPYPSNSNGSVSDRYSYELNSINLTFGFYPELSYGKLRPFFDLGFSNKYYIKREASVRRTVLIDGAVVEETNKRLHVPSLTIGPRIGVGCRFLIDMNQSISAGFNLEAYGGSRREAQTLNVLVKHFYLSYGF